MKIENALLNQQEVDFRETIKEIVHDYPLVYEQKRIVEESHAAGYQRRSKSQLIGVEFNPAIEGSELQTKLELSNSSPKPTISKRRQRLASINKHLESRPKRETGPSS